MHYQFQMGYFLLGVIFSLSIGVIQMIYLIRRRKRIIKEQQRHIADAKFWRELCVKPIREKQEDEE